MKYVLSRFEHDISWLVDYTDDYVLYDRSESPIEGSIVVPNIGSDIYDKLSFIIDNYDSLPEVAVYTKANLFKYITKEEFDLVKDNKTFTPLLTQNHKEVLQDANMPEPDKPFSFYEDGMYYELNYPAYLKVHSTKNPIWCSLDTYYSFPLVEKLGIKDIKYIPFAPGSNYILPKENILKHSKEFYQDLRSYLEWDRYPGEAMIIERGLYLLWKT